jgi:hypothetical protein
VDYKGDDRKIVAFSDFTEDVCVSPIYADRECSRSGGTVCTAKTVGQTDNTAQTHRVTQGYEGCYVTSRRVDEFGNQFKYRAKVRDAQLGRWAWDVFLVVPE